MNVLTALGAYALISVAIASAVGLITKDAAETVLFLLFWPAVLAILGSLLLVAWIYQRGSRSI